MPKIAAGVVKFQKEAFPERKDLFEGLAGGQSPETLFITCSDSRISPNLVTQTEPGEIFVIRNAGNIVAPHTKQTDGGSATIEYAVAALKVQHIVVCGHMGCGAMAAAVDPSGLDALPPRQGVDRPRQGRRPGHERDRVGRVRRRQDARPD